MRFEKEQWRHVPGLPGYLVSDLGRVVSYIGNEARQIEFNYGSQGYARIEVAGRPGGSRYRKVHRLVLEAFVGPCPEGMECRHLNGNKLDNRLENLQWGTPTENMYDRVSHGTHHWAAKTHCSNGHPFDVVNTTGVKRRRCRTCMRQWSRDWKIRQQMKAAGIACETGQVVP